MHSLPFHLEDTSSGLKDPLHLAREEGDFRRNHGKQRGCRCCKLLAIACKRRIPGIEKKGPTDRRGQIVSPEMDGLSSPKLWPRNRQQLHVCGRVCQLKFSSPSLLFLGNWSWEGEAWFSLPSKKASVERSVRNLSPFTPCRGEWERWENAFLKK